MKIILAFTLLAVLSIHDSFGQSKESKQYAFIMVVNREGTKLFFSPVFSFSVDKRGNAACDLKAKENEYLKTVADEKHDVLTSDYFDSKMEADQARTVYIDSEKKAGRTVVESTAEVACN